MVNYEIATSLLKGTLHRDYSPPSSLYLPFVKHELFNLHTTLAGQLRAGGTVVEGTAGNTGIGLAHICKALGYHCVIFMPDTQSQVCIIIPGV